MSKILRFTLLSFVFFLGLSLLLILPVRAQSVYGSIFGSVTDKTGAVIPGAAIAVTDIAKGTIVTVTSNSAGDYSVPHLIPDAADRIPPPRNQGHEVCKGGVALLLEAS